MGISLIVVFAFLAMIFWGFSDFLIQRTIRKVGSIETLAWVGIVGSIGLIPFVIKDFHLLQNSTNLLIIFGLGVISFVSGLLDFSALKKGKLSVVDVVIEAELPITIALSFIFLGEVLTMKQAIIILFIFFGIILTAIRSFSHFRSKIEKGVIIAFIAAIAFGFMNVGLGYSAKTLTPMIAIWGSWVVFTIFSLILLAHQKGFKNFISAGAKNKKLILSMSIIDLLAWVSYALALAKAEVAVVTAITESYPAIALTLGVLINKEKVLLHQYAGAVIAIVCSILISMTI